MSESSTCRSPARGATIGDRSAAEVNSRRSRRRSGQARLQIAEQGGNRHGAGEFFGAPTGSSAHLIEIRRQRSTSDQNEMRIVGALRRHGQASERLLEFVRGDGNSGEGVEVRGRHPQPVSSTPSGARCGRRASASPRVALTASNCARRGAREVQGQLAEREEQSHMAYRCVGKSTNR